MSSALDSVGVSTGSAAFTPPAIDGNLTGKHIVSVEQFARPDLDELIRVTGDLRSRVRTGDQSVLKAVVSLTAVLVVLAQRVIDLCYRLVDPRLVQA